MKVKRQTNQLTVKTVSVSLRQIYHVHMVSIT